MDVSERRAVTQQMYRSSGGYELVVSPVILGLIGYLLDRWLGTLPIITITFVVLALVGVCVKLYYAYKHEMEQHAAEATWAKHR